MDETETKQECDEQEQVQNTESTEDKQETVGAGGDAQEGATNGGETATDNGTATQNDGEKAATDTDKPAGNEEEDGEDERKLFVGGLSWETQQNGLKDYMTQFGEVDSCIIKNDNQTGRSRCFGFVVFKEVAGLDKALEGRPHKVDGKKIDSKKAQPLPKREVKLFVGGVKPETLDETIKTYFTQFGEVLKVDRPKEGGKEGTKYKGFCFITFKKDSTVAQITKKRFHTLDDKEVECKYADPPQSGPGASRGRGRGGGRGFMQMGGGYGGGFGGGRFGYNEGYGGGGGFGFGPYPNPYGGYFDGGFGGGGYGYGQQQSSFGKSGRGRHQSNYKPY